MDGWAGEWINEAMGSIGFVFHLFSKQVKGVLHAA